MLERAQKVAVDAALEAGRAIRGYYKDEYTVRDKGQDNPLTDADLASDAILADRLQSAFPDFGWLSEETVDTPERLGRENAWIVDPLDGTREFTLGIPEFVVSVGLVVRGKAMVGVLYNPIEDLLFSGLVGKGATLNGEPVSVTGKDVLEGARIVCSRTEMKKGWFDDMSDVVPMPVGSVAYKFGLVAAGRAEATFTPRPRNEWDICAGVALVEAAGGRTSNRLGQAYTFNNAD
ncbi:MAG: 3'(2'),5'-bisphosphate nucleotidase CysQ, partial [Myxococcota bacterium]|nr:3'(2'),5'-bisphosphate nucleotidase CysQ [Myxococcota bacterium]